MIPNRDFRGDGSADGATRPEGRGPDAEPEGYIRVARAIEAMAVFTAGATPSISQTPCCYLSTRFSQCVVDRLRNEIVRGMCEPDRGHVDNHRSAESSPLSITGPVPKIVRPGRVKERTFAALRSDNADSARLVLTFGASTVGRMGFPPSEVQTGREPYGTERESGAEVGVEA